MRKPLISVIVPSRGRPERLARLLELLAHLEPRGPSFEVVVALDGAVAEGKRAWDGKRGQEPSPTNRNVYKDEAPIPRDSVFPAKAPDPIFGRVIELPHVGISAAKNAAVVASRGDILLFVNDDVEPQPDFIRQHAAAQAAGHPLVVGASPSRRFEDQTVFDEMIAQSRMIFFYGDMHGGRSYGFRHAWNLNLSVNRRWMKERLGRWGGPSPAPEGWGTQRSGGPFPTPEGWGARGPFAEALRPMMYEDVELAFRLCGPDDCVFYHAAARAIHDHRYGLGDYLRREALLGVMAPVLAAQNSACFRAVFGQPLEGLVRDAREAVRVDERDEARILEQVSELAVRPWRYEQGEEWIRLAYVAHLPLKRRAFRLGLLAAVDHSGLSWQERAPMAEQALAADSVLAAVGVSRVRCESAGVRTLRASRSLPAEAEVAPEHCAAGAQE